MQSYTSLINSIKNENASKVIIQSFINKIWFRNDDNYTVNEIIKQVGKELKEYKNINVTESGQNARFSFISNDFFDYKTGISQGYNYNYKLDNKINQEYITTTLNTFEAICILSDGFKVKYIPKLNLKRKGVFYEKK